MGDCSKVNGKDACLTFCQQLLPNASSSGGAFTSSKVNDVEHSTCKCLDDTTCSNPGGTISPGTGSGVSCASITSQSECMAYCPGSGATYTVRTIDGNTTKYCVCVDGKICINPSGKETYDASYLKDPEMTQPSSPSSWSVPFWLIVLIAIIIVVGAWVWVVTKKRR